MSKKAKTPKPPKASKAARPTVSKPLRKYSDSRERILNNLQKMQGSCKLIRTRFVAWSRALPEDNKTMSRLGSHLLTLNNLDRELSEMYEDLHSILDGFVPPKAVFKTIFEVGDAVSLVPEHRDRYEKVYEADFDKLEIADIDEQENHTDYTVTDGSVKFLVPAKSHLVRVKD